MSHRQRTAYICGKMSGKKDWGMVEFTNKEIEVIRRGYNAINPFFLHEEPVATLEEEIAAGTWDAKWAEYLKKDIPELLKADFLITTGPDWIQSRGARLEIFIAQSLFIPTYGHDWSTLPDIGMEAGFSKGFHKRSDWVKELQDAPLRPGFEDKCNKECGHPMEYPDVSIENIMKGYPSQVDYGESIMDVLKKMPEKTQSDLGYEFASVPQPKSILETAIEVTTGDRRRDYDSATPNHERIAGAWNWYIQSRRDPEAEISAFDVATMMILLKVARMCYTPTRDSLCDIAGYSKCASQIAGFEPEQ